MKVKGAAQLQNDFQAAMLDSSFVRRIVVDDGGEKVQASLGILQFKLLGI
jgi:hypothetical protein